MTAGEGEGSGGELLRQPMGQQTQHRQRCRCQHQRRHGEGRSPAPGGGVGICRGLLPEYRHIDLGEIGHRQSAGQQEQPLHRRDGGAAGLHRQLYHSLVDQRFADVAQKAGDTGQGAGSAQEQPVEQGLAPPEATDAVQIQLVGVVIHHTGKEKEGQLHQRVVQHIQHRTVGGQCVVLPQQGQHGHAHQNEPDLGQGGAGQNVLEVGGERRHHGAQHHGDAAQYQHQNAPAAAARQQVDGDDQNTENTRLSQHTRQQSAGGGRGHRVGLGQPDVQREYARLGGEAEEHAQSRPPQGRAVRHGGAGILQLRQHQCPRQMLEQEQAHQRHQTAQNGDGQIGLSGLQRLRRLLLHHPHIGTEAHKLEEQEGGLEIRRQEHAQRKAQANEEEEIVPPQMTMAPEILGRQHGADEPHEAHHQPIEPLEATKGEGQPHYGGDDDCPYRQTAQGQHGPQHQQRRGDDQLSDPLSGELPPPWDSDADSHDGGQHKQDQQIEGRHSVTASRIRSSSPWGIRPISRQAAASTTMGTSICHPASWTEPSGMAGALCRGNHARTAIWNI